MFRWINGRDPRQYGLDFGIIDAVVGIADLIERKFGIRLGVTAVENTRQFGTDAAKSAAAGLSARS